MIKFVKKNKLLILILGLGLFLRIYHGRELFMYSHDQDLAGWFVRDVVENKHFRLIGQETSTKGIFIGPIYYYFLIPFYLLFGMDPIGGVAAITVLGIFSIWSVYYVFKEILGKREGLVAAFLYTVSFYTIFNDREVVPTMPVLVWTVWYFWGLNLLLKGKQEKGFLILGICLGLIWQLNMALVILVPLIFLSIWLSRKKVQFNKTKWGFLALFVLSTPLLLFEVRHGFSQIKSVYTSLTTNQEALTSGYEQFRRVTYLIGKNIDGFVWGSWEPFSFEVTLILFLLIFFILVGKKVIDKKHRIVLTFWIILYIGFFSVYSKNMSEYYLNGTMVVWIFILTVTISQLISKPQLKKIGLLFLILFTYLNLDRFFNIKINRSGYLYRKAIVNEIVENSNGQDYPCVSVSYITEPGYNFGWRYLYYFADLHVNKPDSGSPVYTIVFPLRDDIEVDKTFGVIGLIYPDYPRYNMDEVVESCSGENSNLTDSLWGFPQ